MGSGGTYTVAGLLTEARHGLAASESARLDTEVLLGMVLGIPRTHIYAHPEANVPPAAAADFTRLVARRAEGYPVAYLTGRREFWSMEFTVSESTLIPRPETELLVEFALAALPDRIRPTILELGTGTGAVSLALGRELPAATIMATDVSTHAIEVARHNARYHDIANVTFIASDWFDALGQRRFDLVLSNPPYVDERDPALELAPLAFEPRIALDGGPGGLAALTRIVAGAGRHLLPGGAIALEHGATQGARVRQLLSAAGFVDVRTLDDAAGCERVTVGTWT